MPEFSLSAFLPYRLSLASNAVSNRIAQVYHETFGLKVTEWRVMAVLGDTGALTQRELAERTLMDKVAVNRACKVLEKRALAVRQPNATDGRSHLLRLTEAGGEMHRQIVPLAREIERALLAEIGGAKGQEDFLAVLDRLHRFATQGRAGAAKANGPEA